MSPYILAAAGAFRIAFQKCFVRRHFGATSSRQAFDDTIAIVEERAELIV
jgi:hypothetical protein